MNVMQAAQHLGVSDKTIRRAIHAGKLPANYPKKNLAEIEATDLEAWYSSATIRPMADETQARLVALERKYEQLAASQVQRIADLEQLVDTLLLRVQASTSSGGKKQRLPKVRMTGSLPGSLVSLTEFADLHNIAQKTAVTGVEIKLIPALRGTWQSKDGAPISLALDGKGRAAFFQSYNSTATFTPCHQCPHDDVAT